MRASLLLYIIILSLLWGSCTKPRNDAVLKTEPAIPASPIEEDRDDRPVIVAFGDSLTAGPGVDRARNYPSQLQAHIDAAGYLYRVVNAGVSGDTSSQGLHRMPAVTALRPVIVIVEFGGNDGLRGLPIETTRANLGAMISGLQSVGAKVVLAGMQIPPNYGQQYTSSFREIFPALAKQYDVAFLPFFLEGVGGHAGLNQDDGIHPTAEGYAIVVENVWKVLRPLL